MVQKTHIGYQEEGILEKGIQIRSDDPVSPVNDQIWLNTTEQRLKLRKDGIDIVILEGVGESLEIPPSKIVDLFKSRSYYKEISAAYDFTFSNFNSGMFVTVRFDNTSVAVQQITELTFPSSGSVNDGDYFIIYSASNLDKFYVWFDLDGQTIADPAVPDATAVPVSFTKGLAEIVDITCPPASDITSGQYFLINSGGDATEYYVWFNKDGAGGDPLVVGKTGLQVAILASDTGDQVATKLASALDGLSDFNASSVSTVVTCETATQFGTTDAANVDVGGAFSILVTQQGFQADSAISIAQKVAAELDSLAQFNAPVPASATAVITNADAGFSDSPENGTMGVGFSFSTPTAGSGPVLIDFSNDVILDVNTTSFVPAESTKIFFFLKVGSFIYANGKEY